MSARSILEKASASGIQIRAADGRLALRGDEQSVAQILPEVKAHKAEILVLLAANDPNLPPELERLIEMVAKAHGFSTDETKEAREIAAGDVPGALTCFRELAAKLTTRLVVQVDSRVTCLTCANLRRIQCQAAAQGLMADTYRGYTPVPDVPRNCEQYRSRTCH